MIKRKTPFPTTEKEIHSLCKRYNIIHYDINEDLSVNSYYYLVNIRRYNLNNLPIKFNKVCDSFACSFNNITTFDGFPTEINGYLDVENNNLKSLINFPIKISGNIWITNNPIYCLIKNWIYNEGKRVEIIDDFNSFDIIRNNDEMVHWERYVELCDIYNIELCDINEVKKYYKVII